MHRLRRDQLIPVPPREVFAFFADAGNLQAITPPFLDFKILTPRPVEMREGTLLDYRLRLFGVPFGWRTLIERWDPPRGFVDRQLSGPYAVWVHRHEFREVPQGTLMTDVVDYALPLGPLGGLAHRLFVARTLRRIFDHRRERIEALLVDGPESGGGGGAR